MSRRSGGGNKDSSRQHAMTVWHSLQRSWPITRVERPINDSLESSDMIALFPNTTKDKMGIQVNLKQLKLGTYRSTPAHLILFKVTLALDRNFPESCLEIRLDSVAGRRAKSDPKGQLYIGAYGPAHIVEKSESPRVKNVCPASMQISPRSQGVLMTVRAREGAVEVVPGIFYVGVVVVHDHPAQVKVLPSTTDCQRAKAFRQTIVRPVNLDFQTEVGLPKMTCALQGEAGCHSSCKDFGEEHMTVDIWKSLLEAGEARFYDEDSPHNWVKYA